MVDEPVDHGSHHDRIAEDLAPGGERLVDVTITEPRSEREETSWRNRLAASAKGM